VTESNRYFVTKVHQKPFLLILRPPSLQKFFNTTLQSQSGFKNELKIPKTMETDTHIQTFKEAMGILKKYPKEHQRLKEQINKMLKDLNRIENMI
jgi:hypothetical protein